MNTLNSTRETSSIVLISILLLTFAVLCAFLMGYSVNQGSTCAVTAAKQLVHEHHATMLTGFAVAIGTAGIICLPLAWIFGAQIHLASDAPVTITLISGAILLGIGALINDACLFGTLSRIGHGEVRFFGLPLGLAIGFVAANLQSDFVVASATVSTYSQPSVVGCIIIAVFGLLLAAAWFSLGSEQMHAETGEWPLRRAMVVLGICGACLFALTPGWTYADAVRRAVETGPMQSMQSIGALLAAAAVLAGALLSGVRARSFVYQKPNVVGVSRSVIGGAVMAFGATLIPGGNDTLLLSAVPAATVSGITAYAIMSLTVPGLLMGWQFVSQKINPQA